MKSEGVISGERGSQGNRTSILTGLEMFDLGIHENADHEWSQAFLSHRARSLVFTGKTATGHFYDQIQVNLLAFLEVKMSFFYFYKTAIMVYLVEPNSFVQSPICYCSYSVMYSF